MSRDEAIRRLEYDFARIFQDYFDGIASWEECSEELMMQARYYERLIPDDDPLLIRKG